MKAITLLQPWASLIALGEKRIETRSWSPRYRGLLAIHASKRWRNEDALLAQQHDAFLTVWRRHGIRLLSELPLGAVIATCRLADVRPTEELIPTLSFEECAFGNYSLGRWAWVLADVEPLAEPVPAVGALGLWDWEGVK